MENANKRYYSRCMYGNYKMDHFEEKASQNEEKGHPERFFGKDVIKALRRLAKMTLLGAIILFLLDGCRTQPPTVIQKEEIIWTYKDSITTRDSICYIPIERYVDIVPIYDTLVLENSISISRSWADTTNHLLRGELKNKNAIQHQVKYIERVVKNDSIVEREVPRPYPVIEEKIKRPWWSWVCLTWTIISIASIGWSVYRRLRY